jgi:tRNA (guanine-N7-)-methyltransferase
VFTAGVGALLKRIDELALANVRIVHHDAVEVVRDMIPRDALAGVHVYFPDPWQKKRHHKRRLVAQPFIGLLASRIAPGGYLHCATDWEDYAQQMLEVLGAEPQLANTADGFAREAANPLCRRPTTKFNARGERLGHGTWDLVFTRR